jgi:putative spermidine/putrescine transport system ATP-binding protein
MAHLHVNGVVKRFGQQTVVDGLDFAVKRGEVVSLLGPSGCGKTTLLRMIAGLVHADEGSITLAGRELAAIPAHRRNVSVVFQSYALFPHLSVRENVAFGPRARGVVLADATKRVDEVLSLVRMQAFADGPVTQLSGGQQQRVAVARALVVQPDLLLLDEPFSALDRKLRETMQIELKALLKARGMTAIFVTHDQDEALTVSDRIAVMNAGRIEQFTDPGTLYAKPATAFALDFVGLSTLLAGKVTHVEEGRITVATASGALQANASFRIGSRVLMGIRPERIRLGPGGIGDNTIQAEVTHVVPLGARIHLYAKAADGDRLLCELPGTADMTGTQAGDSVTLHWDMSDTLIYPASV